MSSPEPRNKCRDYAVTQCRRSALFPLVVGDRYLHVLDMTGHPDRCSTTEQARNLITDLGERVTRFRFLMREYERVRSTWTRSSPVAEHNAPTNCAGKRTDCHMPPGPS
jgi:hypothetical protein